MQTNQPTVGLFITCLVNTFRPSIAWASVKLLEKLNFKVEVPILQTCCGQVPYNSGDIKHTKTLAKKVIQVFKQYDYVVVPSGSCAGMIKCHYLELFSNQQTGDTTQDDKIWYDQACQLAEKTYELVSFLALFDEQNSIAIPDQQSASYKICYHDSCAGLRELNIKTQPRHLLKNNPNIQLIELEGAEECCGFGGAFCIKYPEISNAMVSRKADNIKSSGAQIIAAGDLGCLMNIAGKLKKNQSKMKVYHIAELLAGTSNTVAIGESDE